MENVERKMNEIEKECAGVYRLTINGFLVGRVELIKGRPRHCQWVVHSYYDDNGCFSDAQTKKQALAGLKFSYEDFKKENV